MLEKLLSHVFMRFKVQFDKALLTPMEKIAYRYQDLGFGDCSGGLPLPNPLVMALGYPFHQQDTLIRMLSFSRLVLHTSNLQANILSRTGIMSHGSSLQNALDAFNDICNVDILSVTTSASAPQMMKTLAKCYFGAIELLPAEIVTYLRLFQGKDACLDVTGISPFAGMGANSWAPAVALLNAVEKKKKKYASICEDNGYKFIPFAFSTFGEFDKDALDTLLRIKSISITAVSQRIEIDAILDHNGFSRIKFLNHSTFLSVAAKAINSDSIIELVMQVCFLDAQEIAPPPSRNAQSLHLEEKHVTWARFRKKQDINITLGLSERGDSVGFTTTPSEVKGGDITTTCDVVTMTDLKEAFRRFGGLTTSENPSDATPRETRLGNHRLSCHVDSGIDQPAAELGNTYTLH
ncbi:hypothetical protein Tco_0779483 [Tanacetum coccineum]